MNPERPRGIRPLLLILFLVAVSSAATQALSYQEGIHLIRPDSRYITHDYSVPEYLTVEDLTFVSCLEDDYALRNSILCLDDNSFEDLETNPWSEQDNCYISSANLDNFECDHLLLQAEYTKEGENYKLTKTVRVNKLSKVLDKLLDTQYSDGGWRDPLSTAYGVWALSYFKDIYDYQLDLALDWLKENRNEERKCWPKSPCNMETSANILALLKLSNYTGDLIDKPNARRVVNDARNFFEEMQNTYEQGDTWNISVLPINNYTTLSLVAYDRDVLDENFTLPMDEPKDYSFEARTDKELKVISDDNVIVNISNQDNETLIEYRGDNLTYVVPGPCWSLNRKGEPCDYTTTLFAMASDIDEYHESLAKEWVREKVSDGAILGKYFGDGQQDVVDTSFYVYNLFGDDGEMTYMDQIIDWLLYKQNNEGSWGRNSTAEKAIPTADSILALEAAGYNRTAEPVEDAESWASANEENVSDNNTAALASLFFVLKHNARPLLVSEPKIIVVDQPQTTIQLFNPTTFDLTDLTYEFSEEVDSDLSIETREEIDAYSYRKLTITRTSSEQKDAFGFLTVYNLDDPVAKIPVILTDAPMLNISLPETVTVFGKSGELRVTAKKSSHTLTCTATWQGDELTSPGSIRVSGSTFTIPLSFEQALTKEDSYSGTLTCTAAGKKLSLPLNVYVSRYASIPLSVSPTDVIVNSTDADVVFRLKNNLDRDLTVSVSMDRYGSYFGFRDSVTLNPNEEQNFTLTNNLPGDLNLTSSVLVNFKVFDRTQSASMLIDVTQQAAKSASLLGSILPLLVILAVLGVLGFFAWKYRDALIAELNKLNIWRVKEEKKKENKRIKTLKSTEQRQAIVNLFNIMKFQNKDEKDIAQRLLSSFEREDIKSALEEAGMSLPVLDEEEPERAAPAQGNQK